MTTDPQQPAVPGSLAEIRRRWRQQGAQPLHESHLLRRWLSALPLDGGRRRVEDFLPAGLRAALPAIVADLAALARVASRHPAADGSERLLLSLHDGQTVEAVRMAGGRRARGSLCVSTQVGCAVGCGFCMTGRSGLLRQLGSAEIAAQVAAARTLGPVRKVVFMGMGEPAHNLDAVLEAIDALAGEGGIGHEDLVLSTVGDARVFERLMARRVQPALALSLHTTKPALRETLLPRAPRLAPAELVAAADAYARASGHVGQVQWTLLDGVNDGDDELEALAALLAGRKLMLNFIPYNAVEGLPFARTPWARAAEMARALNQRGVWTRLRRSAGQDVDGGCGQLRARHIPIVARAAVAA